MRRLAPSAIAVCLAAVIGVPADATVVRLPSFARLVQSADLIAITEVADVRTESARTRDGNVPITIVTLRVREQLKGTARVQLVLEFAGGRTNGDDVEIAGQPSFSVGDNDVLFLSEVPGSLGPVAGLFTGRLRVTPDPRGEAVIAADDGRALSSDLSGVLRPALPGGARLTLEKLRRAIRDEIIAGRERRSDSTGNEVAQTVHRWNARPIDAPAATTCLVVELGTSVAFADGCSDWSCVVRRALVSAGGTGRIRLLQPGDALEGCGGVQRLRWAQDVFGRVLDDLTLALSVDRVQGGARSSSILLNQRLPWDSFTSPPRGTSVVDAHRVLAAEFSGAASASAAEGAAIHASSGRPADAAAARQSLRRGVAEAEAWRGSDSRALATGGCESPSGAVVNPRLLIFESPDYGLMTSYEVGFFDPGSDSPARVIDVPLTAFFQRRTIDLPADAAAGLMGTLVADIASAGLATPAGRILTYRVRGVWKGGTTAWSAASPPFVRCTP